jgi:hypothetical protein
MCARKAASSLVSVVTSLDAANAGKEAAAVRNALRE